MKYIIFKDISSKILPLVISKMPAIQSPKRRIENYDLDGRDGNLTMDYGTYEPFTISVEFILMSENINDVREISSWLSGSGKLTLSTEDDKYYNARVTNAIEFAQVFSNGFRNFMVQFECQPYAYEHDNTPIFATESLTLYNHTNSTAKPFIKIKGQGECTITINDEEIHLNISEYIELDCELEEVFKGGLNQSHNMVGEFPTLQVGENKITVSNQVEQIELIPNFRWR